MQPGRRVQAADPDLQTALERLAALLARIARVGPYTGQDRNWFEELCLIVDIAPRPDRAGTQGNDDLGIAINTGDREDDEAIAAFLREAPALLRSLLDALSEHLAALEAVAAAARRVSESVWEEHFEPSKVGPLDLTVLDLALRALDGAAESTGEGGCGNDGSA